MHLSIGIVLLILFLAVADHYYCFACRSWRGDLKVDEMETRFCPCCGELRTPWFTT
jgi:hypothetical protein